MIRSAVSKVLVFILAVLILTGLLVLTAMIPVQMIRSKSLESAEYLYKKELFGTVLEDVEGSRIDKYADAILLNIAYHYDDGHPFSSVMESAYYFTPYQEENENYLEAVREDKGATKQYLRYWHGSIAVVRPLLAMLNVRQIYILNGITLIILAAAYFLMTIRKKMRIPALGMGLSLILTACWFVPLSLEYTWTVELMLIFSMIAIILAEKQRRETYFIFFMLAGIITNYFDFLTAETLTLTMPLLLILWVERAGTGERVSKETCVMALKNVAAWGIGFAGMWVMKWILASLVLGGNMMPYVSEHIEERLSGDLGLNVWQYFTGAVARNIGCLFPIGYGAFGAFAGIGLLILAAYIGYVYHRKDFDRGFILLCAAVALIPYIRFLILHNHSYLHCFFTYRAQMAVIFAIVMIIGELTKLYSSG